MKQTNYKKAVEWIDSLLIYRPDTAHDRSFEYSPKGIYTSSIQDRGILQASINRYACRTVQDMIVIRVC